MTSAPSKKDLIVIAADKNIEQTLHGILRRPDALGIREISFDIISDQVRADPGCLNHSHTVMRLYQDTHTHGMVVFDRVGCGKESADREALEAEVEARLNQNGWAGRSAAVVIDPELEAWVWSDSPHVETALGWGGRIPRLRQWLENKGFVKSDALKPEDPKAAVEIALKCVRKPRSSARYRQIAERVGFGKCIDPAFLKLKTVLKDWFG